jgi:hypothetical protein
VLGRRRLRRSTRSAHFKNPRGRKAGGSPAGLEAYLSFFVMAVRSALINRIVYHCQYIFCFAFFTGPGSSRKGKEGRRNSESRARSLPVELHKLYLSIHGNRSSIIVESSPSGCSSKPARKCARPKTCRECLAGSFDAADRKSWKLLPTEFMKSKVSIRPVSALSGGCSLVEPQTAGRSRRKKHVIREGAAWRRTRLML